MSYGTPNIDMTLIELANSVRNDVWKSIGPVPMIVEISITRHLQVAFNKGMKAAIQEEKGQVETA